VAKLVWRANLVTELEAGGTMEVEVAGMGRDEQAGLSDLGLRLAEAKKVTSDLQAEIVPAQVTIASLHLCGLRVSAGQQGILHCDLPLAFR
jgi:hypothetical protein